MLQDGGKTKTKKEFYTCLQNRVFLKTWLQQTCNSVSLECNFPRGLQNPPFKGRTNALKTGSRKNVARESLFSLKDSSCSLPFSLSLFLYLGKERVNKAAIPKKFFKIQLEISNDTCTKISNDLNISREIFRFFDPLCI